MVNVTICPHFLVDLPTTQSALHIEKYYISPLRSCVSEAIRLNINICLSKELVVLYDNGFPWNRMNDDSWKGYLIDWDSSIRSTLLSNAKISSVPAVQVSSGNICHTLSTQVNALFEALLIKLGSGGMPSNLNPEGVISKTLCGSNSLLSSFKRIEIPSDLEQVLYPWLRIYRQPLPPVGEYPFIPPSSWVHSSSPIRRSNYSNNGYLDHQGNEWKWDKSHNDHWDVQHSNNTNDYTNVNTDGSIR